MKKLASIALVSIFALTACVSSNYRVAENVHLLKLSFADPAWDGKKIPSGQQCQRFGGNNPKTPAIKVMGIPSEANAIVIEYSDGSYAPMDNGGHGKVRYEIEQGQETVVIPPIPGHTFNLPKGFSLVSAHQAPRFDDPGAYLPPCSGGSENRYYATVKAIHRDRSKDDNTLLLAEGVIQMGSY